MLSEAEKQSWAEFEEAAERAGGFLAKPKRPLIIEFDYRAMTEYCCKKGVHKMDLTEEELKMFEFDPPLIYE